MRPISDLIKLSVVWVFFTVIALYLLADDVRHMLIAGVLSALLYLAVLMLLRQRARSVSKLSRNLRSILAGNVEMDIQEYTEGELAVLSADIYKMTTMLREQSSSLMKDKNYLVDAISDISHQLKTPITSMMMLTDLLKKDIDETKKKEFLGQLSSQTARLQWLVKSLLTLSKLDAETIFYKKEQIMVQELIEQASSVLLIPMDIKNQTFRVYGDLETVLTCDRDWTAEAIMNILKNASEHTPEGGSIEVHAENSPMSLQIRIKDSGEGIEAEDLDHIFTRFYKGKHSAKDSIGIGLAISKAIILQQGGGIDVQSDAARTEFILRFAH